MQKRQFIVLVALCICFVTVSFGQHKRYAIKNGIGIQAGLTQFDIITDNFIIKKGDGWIGGFSANVDLPHKWYTVSYGLLLSESTLEISGRPTAGVVADEQLEYKLMKVQLTFLFHAKIIKDHLTIDFGPQLQYNGKLELKDDKQESYFINGYDTLLADDISDISPFNVNGAIGASTGFGSFKLRAQYSYGFTNILGKLNNQNLTTTPSSKKFKGHQSMLSFTAMIIF